MLWGPCRCVSPCSCVRCVCSNIIHSFMRLPWRSVERVRVMPDSSHDGLDVACSPSSRRRRDSATVGATHVRSATGRPVCRLGHRAVRQSARQLYHPSCAIFARVREPRGVRPRCRSHLAPVECRACPTLFITDTCSTVSQLSRQCPPSHSSLLTPHSSLPTFPSPPPRVLHSQAL